MSEMKFSRKIFLQDRKRLHSFRQCPTYLSFLPGQTPSLQVTSTCRLLLFLICSRLWRLQRKGSAFRFFHRYVRLWLTQWGNALTYAVRLSVVFPSRYVARLFPCLLLPPFSFLRNLWRSAWLLILQQSGCCCPSFQLLSSNGQLNRIRNVRTGRPFVGAGPNSTPLTSPAGSKVPRRSTVSKDNRGQLTKPRSLLGERAEGRELSDSPTPGLLSGWQDAWPEKGWATRVVRQGLTWPWISIPKVSFPPQFTYVSADVLPYVSDMLHKGVVERTVGKVFLSRVFTVPKKDSDKARISLST